MSVRAYRKSPTKEQISKMTREQMREEFVQTLLGSLMPLVERVIEKRIYQWFDVISGYDEANNG